MNAVPLSEVQALELVEIIEFKWLMAKDGDRVHVERMQTDPAYARDCLERAAASPSDAVQAIARRLRIRLGIVPG